MNRDYFISEKFIWDDLIRSAQKMVDLVHQEWRKSQRADRAMFAWPSRHLRSEEGVEVTTIVSFAVPDGMSNQQAAKELLLLTDAYALLAVDPGENEVRVTLESHHGTRVWNLPIERHGDVRVLKKTEATTDAPGLGLLWRPQRSNA